MKNKHNQADQIFTRIAKANNRLFSPTGAKGLVKKVTDLHFSNNLVTQQ